MKKEINNGNGNGFNFDHFATACEIIAKKGKYSDSVGTAIEKILENKSAVIADENSAIRLIAVIAKNIRRNKGRKFKELPTKFMDENGEVFDIIDNSPSREGIEEKRERIRSEILSRFRNKKLEEFYIQHYINGLSIKEVAIEMGISQRTADNRKRQLKKVIADNPQITDLLEELRAITIDLKGLDPYIASKKYEGAQARNGGALKNLWRRAEKLFFTKENLQQMAGETRVWQEKGEWIEPEKIDLPITAPVDDDYIIWLDLKAKKLKQKPPTDYGSSKGGYARLLARKTANCDIIPCARNYGAYRYVECSNRSICCYFGSVESAKKFHKVIAGDFRCRRFVGKVLVYFKKSHARKAITRDRIMAMMIANQSIINRLYPADTADITRDRIMERRIINQDTIDRLYPAGPEYDVIPFVSIRRME